MTIYVREKGDHDTLEMTGQHALAMQIALLQSMRARMHLILKGHRDFTTITSFDAKLIDNACAHFLRGCMREADKAKATSYDSPSFDKENPPPADEVPNETVASSAGREGA